MYNVPTLRLWFVYAPRTCTQDCGTNVLLGYVIQNHLCKMAYSPWHERLHFWWKHQYCSSTWPAWDPRCPWSKSSLRPLVAHHQWHCKTFHINFVSNNSHKLCVKQQINVSKNKLFSHLSFLSIKLTHKKKAVNHQWWYASRHWLCQSKSGLQWCQPKQSISRL